MLNDPESPRTRGFRARGTPRTVGSGCAVHLEYRRSRRPLVCLLFPRVSATRIAALTEIHSDPITAQIAARYEAWWALFMTGIVVLLLAVVVFTGVHWASMPPSRLEVVNSTSLHVAGEFVEENLGTAVAADGQVTVRVLAEQYAFRPHCLVLPQGVPVTFRATSSDVVHGLQIMEPT